MYGRFRAQAGGRGAGSQGIDLILCQAAGNLPVLAEKAVRTKRGLYRVLNQIIHDPRIRISLD